MSRKEKLIKEKEKHNRFKKKLRVLFIFVMIINVSIGVYIVRESANDMMGIECSILINEKQLNSIRDKVNLKNIVNIEKIIQFIEDLYKNRT